jgi:hypothetical protein
MTSSIAPSNFRTPKQIAQDILNTQLADSSFQRLLSRYSVEDTDEGHMNFDKNCVELLGNLEAIATGRTSTLSLGDEVMNLIEEIAKDCELNAQRFNKSIHPETRGGDGLIEMLLRQRGARKRGLTEPTAAEHESFDADATNSYYAEKRLAKAIHEKMPPLFTELIQALKREQGRGGRGGRE